MESLRHLARHEPLLERTEEDDLIGRAHAGDVDAVERLILSHLRLAVGEARRLGLGEETLDDILQDAAEALVRAIGRFDPARGARFATFVRWSVREAVQLQFALREVPAIVDPQRVHTDPGVGLTDADLELLDDEARRIILLRFGFLDGQEYSERETARVLGLTRHRVRLREGEAMTRLRRRLATVGPRAPEGADPL